MPDSTENTEATTEAPAADQVEAPAGDDKPGESGEQPKVFTEDYVKALREEAANYRTKLRETEAKFEGAKTADEVEAITTELRSTIAAHEAAAVRREVIAETELPEGFAARLTGTTKEELLADAQALKELLPKPVVKKTGPVAGGLDPTEQGSSNLPADPGESAAKYGPRANSLI